MNGLSRLYSLLASNWLSLYCRQPDLYEESPGSSEYSTESTFLVHTAGNKTEQAQAEIVSLHQDIRTGSQSIHIGDEKDVGECEKGVIFGATTKQGNEILNGIPGPISFLFLLFKIPHWIRITDKISNLIAGVFMTCDEQPNDDGVVSASSSTEFGSPLQVTPLFRSLAAGIPSPKFSESVSYSKTLILPIKLLVVRYFIAAAAKKSQ